MCQLTKAQQTAVEHEGSALLVSAAAGSGKTMVLVERLLRQLRAGHDLTEFLIITYTNAAAAELRGKIAARLSEALAETPDDRHLRRQTHLLYLAQISTIHAFCGTLLRQYAHLRDLPPDFRVAEQTEANAIRLEVFQNTLEDFYRTREQRAEFQALADQLGFGRHTARIGEPHVVAHLLFGKAGDGLARPVAHRDGAVQPVEREQAAGLDRLYPAVVAAAELLGDFPLFVDQRQRAVEGKEGIAVLDLLIEAVAVVEHPASVIGNDGEFLIERLKLPVVCVDPVNAGVVLGFPGVAHEKGYVVVAA